MMNDSRYWSALACSVSGKTLWGPVVRVCALYFILGYFSYCVSLFSWASIWVEQMVASAMTMVGGLQVAQAIAELKKDNPLPAQSVILYCIGASPMLSAWCVCYFFLNRSRMNELLVRVVRGIREKNSSRVWVLFVGIFVFSYCFIFTGLLLLESPSASINAKSMLLHSSGFVSITFLLGAGVANLIAGPGLMVLYVGIFAPVGVFKTANNKEGE